MATARSVARQLAQERGLDIRNPASSVLALNSKDRYRTTEEGAADPTSPFDYVLRSNQNFMTGYFERIALTEIVYTWAIPTINPRNNTMILLYGPGAGTQVAVTVPNGWYTVTTLAAAVQVALRALAGAPLGASVTCTADTTTGIFTVTPTPGNTTIWTFLTGAQAQQTTIFEMMNWYEVDPVAGAQVSGIPSMLPTQFIDIVCSQLTANQDVKDGTSQATTRDVLARFYLSADSITSQPFNNGSTPFKIYRQYTFPKQIRFDPLMPIQGFLKFELYNDAGEPLTTGFPTGTPGGDGDQPDWQMTLLVSET